MQYDNDVLYADLTEFINHDKHPVTGQTMKRWYMKCFYELGRDEVLRIASIVKSDGKDKKKYFSLLLKQAVLKKRGV